MPALDLRRLWTILLAVTAGAVVLFGFFPGIDIRVSALFHTPEAGFWLEGVELVSALRYRIWDLSSLMILLSVIGLFLGLQIGRPALWLPPRIWGFILLLYVIGPGLIVNGLLKSHWGRARPFRVSDFGGPAEFSPFYVISDACDRNCSFVSGEGASSMALGLSLLVIITFFARVPGRWRRIATVIAVAVPVAGGALRLMVGRHFLSDTVFAGLIVLAVALALYGLLLHPGTRLTDWPFPRLRGWIARAVRRVLSAGRVVLTSPATPHIRRPSERLP
jgi:membrane-associated PAP2 superfamily phosphatase